MSQTSHSRKVFCHEIDAAFVAGLDAREQSFALKTLVKSFAGLTLYANAHDPTTDE
jgi:hypothetical protein